MAAPKLSQYYSDATGDGRAYKHPLTNERVPSITTCLKFEAKDALIQWAANKTAEHAALHWQELGRRSDQSAVNYSKYAWKKFRDERAEVGTGVHETIEAEIKGTWDFPDLDSEQEAMVENWHRFNEQYLVEPIHSEVTVWSHKYGYAGTADYLGYITGPGTKDKRLLVWGDWKTARNTWPSNWMQLAALKNADVLMIEDGDQWREEPNVEVDDCAILHIRDDMWEFLLASEHGGDMGVRFSQFLNYRSLWGLDQELKAVERDRKAAEKARESAA